MKLDGRELRDDQRLEADCVVVGSGPAGAAFAREAAALGSQVLVVEAGRWWAPNEFPRGAFSAMSATYRDMGASVVLGPAPLPYVQGNMVGGSSPINGAICWRFPEHVYDEWVSDDPGLRSALPWSELEEVTDTIEARLNVAPTDASIAGKKNELMARGAEALGLSHRPIRRNVRSCRGSGRCLQGCPHGAKLSVDATLLRDALEGGTRVLSEASVTRILREGRRAIGVEARSEGGATITVRAERVVLAASAVQTPGLLLASGIDHGPVGEHFQCHPGVSIAGRFPEQVRMWEGATQGHEVTGLVSERLKFEVLGMGLGVLAGRLDGYGRAFVDEVADMAHWLDWGAAVRSTAHGRVQRFLGRDIVRFSATEDDVRRYRRGLRVMGEMMLAAGATELAPGVRGFDSRVKKLADLERLERDGPISSKAFMAAITHMFGSCRMGSNAEQSVVRPDFRHHTVGGLYVADSSVFPSNLGVNPQVPIMALATICARRALA